MSVDDGRQLTALLFTNILSNAMAPIVICDENYQCTIKIIQ